MKSVLLKVFLGLAFIFAGIYCAYMFLDGLQQGANMFFAIGAIVLIIAGVYCLILSAKSDATVVVKLKNEPINNIPSQSILEKNNALMGDYEKTADARDRLKVLETASEEHVI